MSRYWADVPGLKGESLSNQRMSVSERPYVQELGSEGISSEISGQIIVDWESEPGFEVPIQIVFHAEGNGAVFSVICQLIAGVASFLRRRRIKQLHLVRQH